MAVLWPVVTVATVRVNPSLLASLLRRPLAWLPAAAALAGLVVAFRALARGRELSAFLGSAAFLGGLSLSTAACAYPVLLRATGADVGSGAAADALSLTAQNSAGDASGLRTALSWFVLALALLLVYLVVVWRLHRGKVGAGAGGEGY